MKLQEVNLREYLVPNMAGYMTLNLQRLEDEGVDHEELFDPIWGNLNTEKVGEALNKAGLSWCECAGYEGEPFAEVDPDGYPVAFKTSDGKTEQSLYVGEDEKWKPHYQRTEMGQVFDPTRYPKQEDYDVWFVANQGGEEEVYL